MNWAGYSTKQAVTQASLFTEGQLSNVLYSQPDVFGVISKVLESLPKTAGTTFNVEVFY